MVKDFNDSIDIMKEECENLELMINNLTNEIDRIANHIPQDARNRSNLFSKKRLHLLDFVIKEIPSLLNSKIDLDSAI